MPRPRERVCLQDGLKLDLNGLAQNGFIKHGANIGSRVIRWTHSYWGEIATGMISADMSGRDIRSSLDRNDVNRNGRLRVLAHTALTPTGRLLQLQRRIYRVFSTRKVAAAMAGVAKLFDD